MTKKNVFNQLRCIFFSKRENLSDWMNRVDNTCNVINVHIYNETGPERNERVVNVLNKAFACLIWISKIGLDMEKKKYENPSQNVHFEVDMCSRSVIRDVLNLISIVWISIWREVAFHRWVKNVWEHPQRAGLTGSKTETKQWKVKQPKSKYLCRLLHLPMCQMS